MTASAGITAFVPTFVTVGGDWSGFSLENLIVDGLQDFDSLQILTGDVVTRSLFWIPEYMGFGPTGWYDESYNLVDEENQTFDAATGFYLSLASGGIVTYLGEVKQSPNIVAFSSGVTAFGSGRPYPVKLSDIIFTGQQDFDSLQILTGDVVTSSLFWIPEYMGFGPTGWYDESYALVSSDYMLPDGLGLYALFSAGGSATIPFLD